MAKTTSSKTGKTSGTKKTKPTAAPKAIPIESVCEKILDKLRALNLEPALQNDIAWCLGSYRHDGNPIGLYQMAARALPVLNDARVKNARSVPATLITSLQKALASQ